MKLLLGTRIITAPCSKAPTLATKLATQVYFGYREQPALPTGDLNNLKQKVFSLFVLFWANPVDFEMTWVACTEAIGQCCKWLLNYR